MGKRSTKGRKEEMVNYKRYKRQDSVGKEHVEGKKNGKWAVISKEEQS